MRSFAVVVMGVAALPRRTYQRVADEQQGVMMRLVAEAVVLAGGERVEALKPGAVGAHAEDRAAVRVASHGGAAVEEPPGGDQ